MPERPLKLMIVEDEFIIAEDLAAGVESLGHRVSANVASAEEALEQAAKEPPDIVLMDIRLAGEMDGIEAAELFRSRWETPVVFITAHADQDRLERAKLTLPFGYLLKPIDFQNLKVTIEMAFYTSRVDAERRRAEEALRESEEKWRSITEYSPDHIMLLGLDGTIRFINFTVPDLTREEVIGKPVYDFMPVDFHQDAADCFAEVAATGEPGSYEAEYRPRTGEVRIFESRVGPVFRAGEVVALTVSSTDITERRRLDERIQQAQKLESLSILAGGVAHDFNNLLSAILGNVDLALLDLSPVAPARDSIEAINEAAGRAAELCKQMLAYSGKGAYVVELVDLSAIVQETVHLLEALISKKALIDLQLTTGLPAVKADATQIRQVIMNLITNASEAIGDRSGTVTIRTGAMDCGHEYLTHLHAADDLREGCYVFLDVVDNGCGMDEDTKAKIFDPFFTTKFTGRGLGLAAVLGIIRGHGGAVNVHSEPNRGTTIKILLPAGGAALEAPAPKPGKPLGHGGATVLVVDDDDRVRAVTRKMLERLGYEVLTADDGRETIAILQQQGTEIAVVLLDLTMPHIDGKQTLAEIERLGIEVPVILTSGHSEQEAVRRYEQRGLAGCFLQKPYRTASLRAKLCEILESE
ncbi:MAG: response regulator [bacterium]|nr:response regulator [bacterium]